MKVAKDKKYGPMLKAVYNQYFKENDDGSKLFLIKGLTAQAIKQVYQMKKAAQDKK